MPEIAIGKMRRRAAKRVLLHFLAVIISRVKKLLRTNGHF
jgi:hypothetical protein